MPPALIGERYISEDEDPEEIVKHYLSPSFLPFLFRNTVYQKMKIQKKFSNIFIALFLAVSVWEYRISEDEDPEEILKHYLSPSFLPSLFRKIVYQKMKIQKKLSNIISRLLSFV